MSFYDPRTRRFAVVMPYLRTNAPYALPRFTLVPLRTDAPDFDKDGLADVVEAVYGTNPLKADTDGDGIPDGAEVEEGTDPLGGFIASTGPVATVKTPGAAIDVSMENNLAAVAEGAAGIAVVDISTVRQPTIIAQVDTPRKCSTRLAVRQFGSGRRWRCWPGHH